MTVQAYVTELADIRRLLAAQREENDAFRLYVKYQLKWSSRKLDRIVEQIVHEVEAAIDCTQCANCCRTLEISLDAEDITRLAEYLHSSTDQVEAELAAPGTLCDVAIAQSPCPLLQGKRCSAYAARPRDCREYPHLQKGDIRARLRFIIDDAEDCPILFNVLARMKTELHSTHTPR